MDVVGLRRSLALYQLAMEPLGIYVLIYLVAKFMELQRSGVSMIETAEAVPMLGMVLPPVMIVTLLACHSLEVAFLLYNARGGLVGAEWLDHTQVWLTFLALGMALVENMFRGQNPIVFCICLFSASAGFAFYGLKRFLPVRLRADGKAAGVALVPAVLWLLFTIQMLSSWPLLDCLPTLIFFLVNVALAWKLVDTGDEAYAGALLMARVADAGILALLCVLTGQAVPFLPFFVLNLVACGVLLAA